MCHNYFSSPFGYSFIALLHIFKLSILLSFSFGRLNGLPRPSNTNPTTPPYNVVLISSFLPAPISIPLAGLSLDYFFRNSSENEQKWTICTPLHRKYMNEPVWYC